MPRSVRTNFALTQLPKGSGTETQRIEAAETVVLLTDEEFARLPSDIFTDGALDDLGGVGAPGDSVSTQAAVVAAPAALTSAVAAAAPTKGEYDALRADVVALRTTVANLLVALKGAGKPMAAS